MDKRWSSIREHVISWRSYHCNSRSGLCAPASPVTTPHLVLTRRVAGHSRPFAVLGWLYMDMCGQRRTPACFSRCPNSVQTKPNTAGRSKCQPGMSSLTRPHIPESSHPKLPDKPSFQHAQKKPPAMPDSAFAGCHIAGSMGQRMHACAKHKE